MRQEALFIETPMPKGCVTCKKLHLKCDERKPSCKRCTYSGRTCEGYVCVSTARKPTDVTPESVLEFRQKCLPSRERPSKALVVRPTIPITQPKILYTIMKSLSIPKEILNVVVGNKEQEKKEREMRIIKLHEPIGERFDLRKPEGCPVVRNHSAFVLSMYRVMIDVMTNRAHTTETTMHGVFVANAVQGRRK